MRTEIAPLLIVTKLEEYDYSGATAIATVMLLISFVLLLGINGLQRWSGGRAEARRSGGAGDAPGVGAGWLTRCRRASRRRSRSRRWSSGCSSASPCSFSASFCSCRWAAFSPSRSAKASAPILRRFRDPDTLSSIRLTLLAAVIAVPLQPRLRRCGRVGHRQVRVFRQKPADLADRSAVFDLAGRRGADVRAALRKPRLVRRRG